MTFIILDLEMNQVKAGKRERPALHREIIEIGAVALNESFEEVGKFMTYVQPTLNPVIEAEIEKLTGISTAMVQDAPLFNEAMESFLSWLAGLQDEVQLVEWSNSDRTQMLKELAAKAYPMDDPNTALLENWHDLQKEFGRVLGLTRSVSLENALMYAGEDFEGRQHDAFYDARNTGYLMAMIRDPEGHRTELDKVKEYLKPKSIGTSMGDLFDFSKLNL